MGALVPYTPPAQAGKLRPPQREAHPTLPSRPGSPHCTDRLAEGPRAEGFTSWLQVLAPRSLNLSFPSVKWDHHGKSTQSPRHIVPACGDIGETQGRLSVLLSPQRVEGWAPGSKAGSPRTGSPPSPHCRLSPCPAQHPDCSEDGGKSQTRDQADPQRRQAGEWLVGSRGARQRL